MILIQSRSNYSKKDTTLAGYQPVEIDSLLRRNMRVEPKENNKPWFHPMSTGGIDFLIFLVFFLFQNSEVGYHLNFSYNTTILCPLESLDRHQSTAVLHPPALPSQSSHQPTVWYRRSQGWTWHSFFVQKITVSPPAVTRGWGGILHVHSCLCQRLRMKLDKPKYGEGPPLRGPVPNLLCGLYEGNPELMLIVLLSLSRIFLVKKEQPLVPISNYLIADRITTSIDTLLQSQLENQYSSQGGSWRGEESFAFS